MNSLKMKKVFKEKSKTNLASDLNIKVNKKPKKLSKQPSCTTRANIKIPFDISTRSINKKKSKKGFKKLSEKQGGQLISQSYGKENRPPVKTNSRTENMDTKRSSVPRVEFKKLPSRKQFATTKKSISKKSSTKLCSKSNSNLGESGANSSILGFSNSRSKLINKKAASKYFQTATDEEKKALKELDALYYLVINCKFISEIDTNGLQRK